jgi:vitamin B12 transporter
LYAYDLITNDIKQIYPDNNTTQDELFTNFSLSGLQSLKPERSFNTEAGIQYSSSGNAWQTRVVYFQRHLRDGIDYSFVDFRYFNNNSARDKGLELESFYRKDRWNISFNYTWQEGEVNTVKYRYDPATFSYIPDGDTSYNYQFRRPRHSVNLTVGYQLSPAFYLSLHGRYAGNRFEPRFMQSPIELDSYTVLDLYAEYRLGKRLRFYLDLKNIADAEYIDINGFTTRPRNFMAGINLSF